MKQQNSNDRQDFLDHQRELEEYEPVITKNKKKRDEITEQLVPIKEQIDQVAALVTPRPQTIVVGGTLQI